MTTFFLLRTAVIWFKRFLNKILLEFYINTCLCSSSMFLILPSYCFNWWRACNWNLICFVMKIFGPISQRFCLFEIPPQFSLSVWFFLLSIVKVWHLQMMMIIIFSNYDGKGKNLKRRSRLPISSRILLQQLNWNQTTNRFGKFWLFVCWWWYVLPEPSDAGTCEPFHAFDHTPNLPEHTFTFTFINI